MAKRSLDKLPIAFAAGNTLRQQQIVDLKAPARRSAGVLILDRDQAPLPSGRCNRRLRADGVCVVAEGRIEIRSVAEAVLDLVASLGVIARIDIRLAGDEQRLWSGGELAENRLTPDDNELVIFSDGGRGADDVLELPAAHGLIESLR